MFSDDFGYFALRSVARGRPFVIDVAAPNHPVIASEGMTLTGESMTGVLLTVADRGQTVRGTVAGPNGQPLSNVRVQLRWFPADQNNAGKRGVEMSILRASEANRSVMTGRDGSFEFAGVAEGTVRLDVNECGRPQRVLGRIAGDSAFQTAIHLPCMPSR